MWGKKWIFRERAFIDVSSYPDGPISIVGEMYYEHEENLVFSVDIQISLFLPCHEVEAEYRVFGHMRRSCIEELRARECWECARKIEGRLVATEEDGNNRSVFALV